MKCAPLIYIGHLPRGQQQGFRIVRLTWAGGCLMWKTCHSFWRCCSQKPWGGDSDSDLRCKPSVKVQGRAVRRILKKSSPPALWWDGIPEPISALTHAYNDIRPTNAAVACVQCNPLNFMVLWVERADFKHRRSTVAVCYVTPVSFCKHFRKTL